MLKGYTPLRWQVLSHSTSHALDYICLGQVTSFVFFRQKSQRGLICKLRLVSDTFTDFTRPLSSAPQSSVSAPQEPVQGTAWYFCYNPADKENTVIAALASWLSFDFMGGC